MSTFFDQKEFLRLREQHGLHWGRPVRVFESIASTNDEALSALQSDAKTGIVWLAKQQSQGRGRRGNRWSAAPGECLMMSTLIRHPGPPGRLLGLSLVVGLAVRDMAVQLTTAHAKAEAASCNIQVKWPNDVMANGKKIAGILVEARNEGKETGVVIGIGLNLLTLEFPEDLPSASSLALLGVPPEKLSLEHSLALLLQHLETRLTDFFKGGISSLIPELRATDYLLNKKVRIENVTGTGTGLDDSGRLLVNESGSIRAIDSGHVELLSD